MAVESDGVLSSADKTDMVRLKDCVQDQIASLVKEVQQLRERIYVLESRPSLQDSQLGTIAADMDNLRVQLALTQKSRQHFGFAAWHS